MKKILNIILIFSLILLTRCLLVFQSIDQPNVAFSNELITVPLTVNTEGGGGDREPYFGVCLPFGWTIPGDSVLCSGVYSEVIYYDDSIATAQNDASPAPQGYYWWAGKGIAVPIDSGLVFAELQIQTNEQTGTFSIDYMLGYTYSYCCGGGGVNLERSNNHQIDIIANEFTPWGLQANFINGSVLLDWSEPLNTNGLLGYYIYRDDQQINPILITESFFTDENPLAGIHSYYISSLYNNGNQYSMQYEVEVRSVLSDSLYVSPDGDDSNGGTSYEDPLRTISCAISILESDSLYHKIIFLAAGVYSPSTNGEIFPLVWKNYISLEGISEETTVIDGDSLGGNVEFNSVTNVVFKNITVRNSRGIDCISSSVEFFNIKLFNNNGDGIYCENSNPTLENIIISGNNGNGITCNNSNPSLTNVAIIENEGSGVNCTTNSSPTLVDVIISNNNGDGIDCRRNSTPSILDVTIINNEGHGINCIEYSSPELKNVSINNNNGGGIFCEDNSNPILDSVSISNNSTSSYGGGIYCNENSSPHLYNVTIESNSAIGMGGGISCRNNSNPQLINVDLIGNNATQGGGIYCNDSDPTLQNVIITNNSSMHGAGSYFIDSSPILKNVTFTNNSANYSGGGIYSNNSIPLLLNVTISGNSAQVSAGGIFCSMGSNPILKNCILWNDTPVEIFFFEFGMSSNIMISYSDIQGGEVGIVTNNNGTVYWQEGNMVDDPLFNSIGDYPYTLLDGSQCIDTGDPNSIYNDPEDPNNIGFAMWPAKGTIRNDMGAYGGPSAGFWNIVTGIEDEETEEIKTPAEFELSQNYPNPFNPSTTIKYSIKERSTVELVFYDILGAQVKVLVNEEQDAGHYKVNFNAENIASGVYIYRLRSGSFIETKKMVLMK